MSSSKQSAREIIAEVVNSQITKAKIKRLLEAALQSEITVDATCPDCGNDTLRARIPDLKRQLDFIVGLLEQAEGRPEQRTPGAVQVVIRRPTL